VTQILEEHHLYDEQRLPTYVVLPVLAAIHATVPKALDAHGNARTLLRRYLWSAFVTRRYESAASGKALQDYRGLRETLASGEEHAIPMLDRSTNPLPTVAELKRAGWPKSRETLARGVLAVTLRRGALDIADGRPVTRAHLHQREYHHLFPDALLSQDGGLDSSQVYVALNCALITWSTNRTISAKEPLRYLRERADQATLGEPEIRARLATHMVPYDQLNVGNYATLPSISSERQTRIRGDYEAFLDSRAELILEDISRLCAGQF
jgi:hypothetical protein